MPAAPTHAAGSQAKLPRWRFLVAYAMGLFAAGILIFAASTKACDPALFIDQITAHKVTPASWSPAVAYFFITVELLAAAAFVAFIWPRLIFGGTILMMLGFIGVTAYAWALGNTEGCGCFGRLVERGPQEVILEDIVVMATSFAGLQLLGGLRGRGRFRTRPWRWVIAVPLILAAVLITIYGPALPVDGFVVGISRGTDLSDIALQGIRFPVDEGWVLLALVGPECPACDAGIPALKEVVTRDTGIRVVAAFPGTRGAAQAWRMKHLPNFPIAHAAERALRQYYRAVPAVFLLHDGRVEQAWWNRVPSADEVAAAVEAS